MIPKYINCQNEEIIACDYIFHEECKNSCAYVESLGIGAAMPGDFKRLGEIAKKDDR